MDYFVNSPSFVGLAAYITSWLAVSYGIYRIFEKAEDVLNTETKEAVSKWLNNAKISKSVLSFPQTFANTFDSVFGKKHISWKCFSRSCLISFVMGIVVLLIWVALRPDEVGQIDSTEKVLFSTITLFFGLLVFNFIPDYFSLLETRFIIGLIKHTLLPWKMILFIVIDIIITSFIAAAAFVVIVFPIFDDALLFTQKSFIALILGYFEEVLPLTGNSTVITQPEMETSIPFPFFSICFYTSFFTSVWLWLYTLSSFAVKLFNKLNITISFIKKHFDINNKPLSSLGFIAMIIVTVLYITVPLTFNAGDTESRLKLIEFTKLRSKPITLPRDEAMRMIQQKDFYEIYGNPRGQGIQNQHTAAKLDSQTIIIDASTGLIWQEAGSKDNMIHDDVEKYIQYLNREQYAGYSDWRLPTLEEAMSLMEPEKKHDNLYYIDPIFDINQLFWNCIWTADIGPDYIDGYFVDSSRWIVSFKSGSILLLSENFLSEISCYVCAVRSY